MPELSDLPDTRSARGAIFQALRATPAAARPAPDLAPFHSGRFGRGATGEGPDPASLVAGFEQAASGWRAELVHASDAGWPAAVRAALDRHRCRRIAYGQGVQGRAELEAALAGLDAQPFERALQDWKHELFDTVEAGVTGCAAGIADTGTLVLLSSPGEPRTLSLVPPVHVALLRTSRLYASLPAAMRALRGGEGSAAGAGLPTNLVLISGPSKTADIQQVLAYGAHGPKVLVIVLVDDLARGAAA